MAVTQQLVRLAQARLLKCQQNVSELDRILSFKLDAGEAVLDLDWAPRGLEIGFATIGYFAISELFGEGAQILNEAYPGGPDDYTVYSPITYLTAQQVVDIWTRLSCLSGEERSSVVAHACEFEVTHGMSAEDAASYVENHLDLLNEFLSCAVRQGQPVVSWWD